MSWPVGYAGTAIGRVPNTETLTPEVAGIRLDAHGFIDVDEYLETSVPGIYAMGDIKGGPAFTHLSYDDYRILHANLIKDERASIRGRTSRTPCSSTRSWAAPA